MDTIFKNGGKMKKVVFLMVAWVAVLVWIGVRNAKAEELNWYSGPKSSCHSLQVTLTKEGMLVIATSEATYFRPVREPALCQVGEKVQEAFTKTRDVARCWVGYVCK